MIESETLNSREHSFFRLANNIKRISKHLEYVNKELKEKKISELLNSDCCIVVFNSGSDAKYIDVNTGVIITFRKVKATPESLRGFVNLGVILNRQNLSEDLNQSILHSFMSVQKLGLSPLYLKG